MNKITPEPSHISDSWNTYWQGTGNVGAFTNGGASHPAIQIFWDKFFSTVKHEFKKPKLIDIASGNGAVIECAIKNFEGIKSEISTLDVSAAAIENIHSRFPSVQGIVSDARSIPRKSGSFDIVTSQFGVEYAGYEALLEAARLVADGGVLAFLLHCNSGSIHLECLQSLDAIKQLEESQFIPLAKEMFDAGFKAVRGADRSTYEDAAKALAPAIYELEEIMRQHGQHVAGDTILKLYNDVGQIHQRIQHYQPDDVIKWLNRMEDELSAYSSRMSSMCNAAIDKTSFAQIKSDLLKREFTIESAESLLVSGYDLPMAWVLIARK